MNLSQTMIFFIYIFKIKKDIKAKTIFCFDVFKLLKNLFIIYIDINLILIIL